MADDREPLMEQQEQQLKRQDTFPGDRCFNPGDALLLAGAFALPNTMLVLLFSAIGSGLYFYEAMASGGCPKMGYALLAAIAALCCLLYVLNLPEWGRYSFAVAWAVLLTLLTFVAALLGPARPWAPLVTCQLWVLVLLMTIRNKCSSGVLRSTFWGWVCVMASLCALALLGVWCSWVYCLELPLVDTTFQCQSADEHGWDAMEKNATSILGFYGFYDVASNASNASNSLRGETVVHVRKQRAKANTVFYMIWAGPAAAAYCNIAIAFLTYCLGVRMKVDSPTKVSNVSKMVVIGLSLFTAGLYVAATQLSEVAINLSNTFGASMLIGMLFLLAWAYSELGLREKVTNHKFREHVKECKLASMLMEFYDSPWGRAMLTGGFNVLIPLFLALDRMRQHVRRCRGKAQGGEEDERYTNDGKLVAKELEKWHWATILVKICLLGELFFTFQVGVAKLTYIFLSYLNEQLNGVDFTYVVLLIFVIGYSMFLLPPVPGVPVYVFSGIVVTTQGTELFGSFPAACGVATLLAFALKLAACTGQYAIGYFAGKSVKIQQLIGVDTVPTRAIEQILKRPGLNWGKVAVLVGGPDWPTSVTCGILRCNLLQMLFGTSPVIVVLAPCVLAGAYMARSTPGVESTDSMLASLFIGLSSLVQGGSLFEAMRNISNVIMQEGDELAKPRKEHEAVQKLTDQEKAYNEVYMEALNWNKLHCLRKLVVLFAAVLIFFSCGAFGLLSSRLFEEFEVSSRISDDIDNYGLGGDVTNVVKRPLGLVALAMFFAGVFLHLIFMKDAECLARKERLLK